MDNANVSGQIHHEFYSAIKRTDAMNFTTECSGMHWGRLDNGHL